MVRNKIDFSLEMNLFQFYSHEYNVHVLRKLKKPKNTKYDVKEKTSQFLGCVIYTR